jgi:nucleolar protein 16
MARPMQKRKRRSGAAKVQTHNRRKKVLNPCGNDIVAKNWDKKLTLTQNYRNLGLIARLKPPTGGVERPLQGASATTTYTTKTTAPVRQPKPRPFSIAPTEQRILSETRVERDADGNIVRVIKSRRRNPLDDPLVDLDSENSEDEAEEEKEEEEEWGGIGEEDDGQTEVVRELERQANRPIPKQRRLPSEREVEWLERLVRKHGDNVRAMAKDARLNPMQQSVADIGKRLKKAYGEDWVDKVRAQTSAT